MRRWRWVFIFVLLVAAGAFWYWRGQSREEGTAVEVQAVVRQPVFRSKVAASGEIVATRYADIGSNVMGRIVELPVREGDEVRQGQLLARIDPVQARIDVDEAEAVVRALEAEESAAREQIETTRSELLLAEARNRESRLNLERIKHLHTQKLVPDADLDAAQVNADATSAQVAASQTAVTRAEMSREAAARRVVQARTQTEGAQDILSKTEIRSPISGQITRLDVREGEMVVIGIQNQPGTRLMTVSDLAAINAEVKVAEADILRVGVGQTAEVTLDALPERVFPGQVVEVGASALAAQATGAAAREFRVVIRLDNPDPGLRPGLTCDAEILTTELNDVLTVPLQAVVLREFEGIEQTGVFVVRDGVASFQPAKAGVIGGLDIVVEGIEEGSSVVAGPFQVLRTLENGSRVRTSR